MDLIKVQAETCVTQSENEGLWFDLQTHWGEPMDGVRVLVASLAKPEYEDAVNGRMRDRTNRQLAGSRRKNALLPDVPEQFEIENKALAKHILLGWDGIDDGDKPFPVTPKNKILLLEGRGFREQVIEFAGDVAAFQEAELGNLKSSPPQSSEAADTAAKAPSVNT